MGQKHAWVVKGPSMRCLGAFIIAALGCVQWKEQITFREFAGCFGMNEKKTEIISKYRCQWLGHLARITNDRIPKQLLFGELIKTCPRQGPRFSSDGC